MIIYPIQALLWVYLYPEANEMNAFETWQIVLAALIIIVPQIATVIGIYVRLHAENVKLSAKQNELEKTQNDIKESAIKTEQFAVMQVKISEVEKDLLVMQGSRDELKNMIFSIQSHLQEDRQEKSEINKLIKELKDDNNKFKADILTFFKDYGESLEWLKRHRINSD